MNLFDLQAELGDVLKKFGLELSAPMEVNVQQPRVGRKFVRQPQDSRG